MGEEVFGQLVVARGESVDFLSEHLDVFAFRQPLRSEHGTKSRYVVLSAAIAFTSVTLRI